VAAGYCPLALGTQTIGSVIRPAAFCGVIGFKPTYGRIDTTGLVFCAPSFDHVGLFTQDVEGMALAASLLCADWQPVAGEKLPVLGVPEGPYLAQAAPEALAAFQSQLARLNDAGIAIRYVRVLDEIAEIARRHVYLMKGEMAATHATWFARYAALYHPTTAAAIREGQGVGAEEKAAVRMGQAAVRAELETVMDEAGFDLWVCPAAPGPAPRGLASTGNPAMNLLWTHAGMPAITVPAGRADDGLPLGLQCVGRTMADERLLAWASHLARVLGPLRGTCSQEPARV
jgi:Asp-tRNA(Asn)/Glu-tRNA(Gln) amidotransferase A subunit family amidase